MACLGWIAAAPLGDAIAQSRDVYLGSTGSRDSRSPSYAPPTYVPPTYVPPAPRPYGWQRRGSETDGLLEDALEDLARGRILEARRFLEMVVEQFGNTASADEARRLLAPIYAGMPGQTRSPIVSPPAVTQPTSSSNELPGPGWIDGARTETGHTDSPARSPQRPTATETVGVGLETAAERKWKLDANRVRLLEQEFRANVGDRIFFGEASAELGSRSRVVLAAQADWLKRYPDVTIAIESHADDHGSQDFNRELARRRAAAVRERLIEEGVEAARIRVNPQGRDNPVATCADAACAAQNRRVLTQLVPPDRLPPAQPRAAYDGASGNGRRN